MKAPVPVQYRNCSDSPAQGSNTLYFCLLSISLMLYLAVFCSASLASDGLPSPKERLTGGFFPPYLRKAHLSYIRSDSEKCYKILESLKVDSYTNQPERYYLLKALCAPQTAQPEAARQSVDMALREKGSSSDILYASAIILAHTGINEQALQLYNEALWFNNFSAFKRKDFYFDLGALQHKMSLLSEAKTSLEMARSLGDNSFSVKSLLCDIAIRTADRKTSILLARDLMSSKRNDESKEIMLIALMVSADPLLHRRDIIEAANLADNLPDSSIKKTEVALASVRALLILNRLDAAGQKLSLAIASNPAEPRLANMQKQIELQTLSQKQQS